MLTKMLKYRTFVVLNIAYHAFIAILHYCYLLIRSVNTNKSPQLLYGLLLTTNDASIVDMVTLLELQVFFPRTL